MSGWLEATCRTVLKKVMQNTILVLQEQSESFELSYKYACVIFACCVMYYVMQFISLVRNFQSDSWTGVVVQMTSQPSCGWFWFFNRKIFNEIQQSLRIRIIIFFKNPIGITLQLYHVYMCFTLITKQIFNLQN